ncbi:hypothetical protein M8C21_029708 [Ambrosia artemisiifolia]|uniref:Uncharacterized protein n=1 Tax=Ambrosia artemisiifolia TaxID=4212 RepID=A0AAD5BL74_AMBAR|nr:hypothetical protein M8C21_029708 [Ambrosia artemisiifolia]
MGVESWGHDEEEGVGRNVDVIDERTVEVEMGEIRDNQVLEEKDQTSNVLEDVAMTSSFDKSIDLNSPVTFNCPNSPGLDMQNPMDLERSPVDYPNPCEPPEITGQSRPNQQVDPSSGHCDPLENIVAPGQSEVEAEVAATSEFGSSVGINLDAFKKDVTNLILEEGERNGLQ